MPWLQAGNKQHKGIWPFYGLLASSKTRLPKQDQASVSLLDINQHLCFFLAKLHQQCISHLHVVTKSWEVWAAAKFILLVNISWLIFSPVSGVEMTKLICRDQSGLTFLSLAYTLQMLINAWCKSGSFDVLNSSLDICIMVTTWFITSNGLYSWFEFGNLNFILMSVLSPPLPHSWVLSSSCQREQLGTRLFPPFNCFQHGNTLSYLKAQSFSRKAGKMTK